MGRERLELSIYATSRRCHNQLDHRPPYRVAYASQVSIISNVNYLKDTCTLTDVVCAPVV